MAGDEAYTDEGTVLNTAEVDVEGTSAGLDAATHREFQELIENTTMLQLRKREWRYNAWVMNEDD